MFSITNTKLYPYSRESTLTIRTASKEIQNNFLLWVESFDFKAKFLKVTSHEVCKFKINYLIYYHSFSILMIDFK